VSQWVSSSSLATSQSRSVWSREAITVSYFVISCGCVAFWLGVTVVLRHLDTIAALTFTVTALVGSVVFVVVNRLTHP
jgi:hypothetical protein